MASILTAYLFLSQQTHSVQPDSSSTTITCNDPSGCDWNCPSNGTCDRSIFHCPSTVDHCSLTCQSCIGTTVSSSSPLLEIYCTEYNGCPSMEITSESPLSHIELHCTSTHCNDVQFHSFPDHPQNCLCLDYGEDICSNHVLGTFSISDSVDSFSSPQTTGHILNDDHHQIYLEKRSNPKSKAFHNSSNNTSSSHPEPSEGIKSMDVTTSMNGEVFFAEDESESDGDSWKRMGLYGVAGTLTVAFICILCVCIPCFIWRTKRKSKLNLKASDIDAHRHHKIAYHTRIPSNTGRVTNSGQHIHVVDESMLDEETVDGVYGPGPAAVTNSGEDMEMVPINEDQDEYDHFDEVR